MNPAENALNAVYPPALRIVALYRRHEDAMREADDTLAQQLSADIRWQIEDLGRAIDAIEAGIIDETMSTSIAGVMRQIKMRMTHN